MSGSVLVRGCASLLAGALVVTGLTLGSPAYAAAPDVDPTPGVSAPAEPSVSPSPESTDAPPAEGPAPEVAPEPDPEPSAPEPTPAATAGIESVTYTGRLQRVADRELDEFVAATSHLFAVDGLGLVRVDVAGLDLGTAKFEALTLRLEVPRGLEMTGDDAHDFALLSEASLTTPLTVLERVTTARMRTLAAAPINQTPHTAAVHRIYAVLVSPSNAAKGANQDSSSVMQAVAHADTFWGLQSGEKITVELEGVTSWYKSGYSCSTITGSENLWTQASTKARDQLGYEAGQNVHLVLFFPSNHSCGGAIGLGTVGYSVNEGGLTWVIGTNSNMAKHTLAHELGHNFSFGHASWLDCTSADPRPGSTACPARPYGDIVDVMGFGMSGKSGGALSAPSAIRGGLWAEGEDYVTAEGAGPQTYTLQSVTSHDGVRGVVVPDSDGTTYFVEFRDGTAEDSQYAGLTCVAGSHCIAGGPSVRVLRFEQQVLKVGSSPEFRLKGFPGDDSQLIGRTASGAKKVGYLPGDTFVSRSGAQSVKVEVAAISGSTATVQITLPTDPPKHGEVFVYPTLIADWGNYRVGDTVTAFLYTTWYAERYEFQWYRFARGAGTGTPISGATSQNYVLSVADLDAFLQVRVTGYVGATPTAQVVEPPYSVADPAGLPGDIGPVLNGYLEPGTVTVTQDASGLTATPSGWPGDTAFTYQWFRGKAPIAGAAGKATTYVPVAADNGSELSVTVTGRKPGYLATSVTSAARDYSLKPLGTPTIAGTRKVGHDLTVAPPLYTADVPAPGSAVVPDITYQWYRGSTAISGATSATYRLTASDVGTNLTVQVTAKKGGYAPHGVRSASAGTIVKGTVAGTLASPEITTSGTTKLKLTAALPTGSVTEPGVTTKYQWLRGSSAIAKATSSSYTLTASDDAARISVRVTVSKSGYDTVTLVSAARVFTQKASGKPLLSGIAKVGRTLQSLAPTFTADGDALTPTLSYQWLRSGTAISGATGETYLLTAADKGKKISLKVTATLAGYQTRTVTSAATAAIGTGVIAGSGAAPAVSQSGLVLTATLPAGSITEPGVTTTYQWYRGSTAISGAKSAAYTLATADASTLVSVRVTVKKSGFTTRTLTSVKGDYRLVRTSTPKLQGDPVVGGELSVVPPTYTLRGAAATPTIAYQWLRNGAAIPGATGDAYTVTASDAGATLKVRMTPTAATAVGAVFTTAATPTISIERVDGAVTVTKAEGGLKLTATATAVQPGVKFAYQWYRDGKKIAKATSTTYTLKSADAGALIGVRVVMTKSRHLSLTLAPTPESYTLDPGTLTAPIGPVRVHAHVEADFEKGTHDPDGAPGERDVRFQWYRGSTAIAGATMPGYTLTPSDAGKKVSVRVTESRPGWLSAVTTWAAPAVLPAVSVVADPAIPVLVGAPRIGSELAVGARTYTFDGDDVTGEVAPTYQWLRNGKAIPGATADRYELTEADRGAAVSVRVTTAYPGAGTDIATSAATQKLSTHAFTPIASPSLTDSGSGVLTAPGAVVEDGPQPSYQWYRAGTAVSGRTGPTYTLSAADFAKTVHVRVTTKAPDHTTHVWTSTPTDYSVQGPAAVTISGSAVLGGTLTAPSGVFIADGAAADVTYTWYRDGKKISGATSATYAIKDSDRGMRIAVRVQAAATGFVTYDRKSAATAKVGTGDLAGDRAVPVVSANGVGKLTSVLPGGSITTPGVKITRQWLRNGTAISGAVSAGYTLKSADRGTSIQVRYTISKPGYRTVKLTSTVRSGSLTGSAPVTITGDPLIGETLAVASRTYSATGVGGVTPTVTAQWYRGSKAIAGATGMSYAPTAADFGAVISVKVTISHAGFLTVTEQAKLADPVGRHFH